MNRDLIEKLNDIANRAYQETSALDTANPDIEQLIQQFAEQFDQMSRITHSILNPHQEINPNRNLIGPIAFPNSIERQTGKEKTIELIRRYFDWAFLLLGVPAAIWIMFTKVEWAFFGSITVQVLGAGYIIGVGHEMFSNWWAEKKNGKG